MSKPSPRENSWTEFEYNKLKLLLHPEKTQKVLAVLNGKAACDDSPPISVELHLTNRCNLRCRWCGDRMLRAGKGEMRKRDVFALFRYFSENGVGVTIEGGGEPTLHPDFEEIVAFGAERGVHMGLLTNGVNDVSGVIDSLVWARFSLDATSREEYRLEKGNDRFEMVMGNIRSAARKRNPEKTHIGVGFVMTKDNIENIMGLLPELDAMGVDYLYMRPVEESPGMMPTIRQQYGLKQELIEFENRSPRIRPLLNLEQRLCKDNERLPCVAHSLTCIIQASGDVALCEKRRHDMRIFGNIRRSSFEEIWRSPARHQASLDLLRPENQIGCEVCRLTSFNRMFSQVHTIRTRKFI